MALDQLDSCMNNLRASYRKLPKGRDAFTQSTAQQIADDLISMRFLARLLLEEGVPLPQDLQQLPYGDVFPQAAVLYTSEKLLDHAITAAGHLVWWDRSSARQQKSWRKAAEKRLSTFKQYDPAYEQGLQSARMTAVQHMIDDLVCNLKREQASMKHTQVNELQCQYKWTQQSVQGYFQQQLQHFVAEAEKQITAREVMPDDWQVAAAAASKFELVIMEYKETEPRRTLDPSNHCQSVLLPAQSKLCYKAKQFQSGRQHYLLQQLLPMANSYSAAAAGGNATGLPACSAAPALDMLPTIKLEPDEQLLLAQPVESRSGMFLYVVRYAASSRQGPAECRMHLTHRNTGNPLGSAPLLTVKRHVTAASFDQTTRLLLLISGEDQTAKLYMFDEHYHAPRQHNVDIKYGERVPNVKEVMLVSGKKELLMSDGTSIYLYDVISNNIKSARLDLPPSTRPHVIIPAPGGSVLAVLAWQGVDGLQERCCSSESAAANAHSAPETAAAYSCQDGGDRWVMYAFCLEQEANKPLLAQIQQPIDLSQLMGVGESASFRLCSFGDHIHLVAFELGPAGRNTAAGCQLHCSSVLLHVTNFSQANILRARDDGDATPSDIRVSGSVANALLDYVYSSFNKFPARSALGYAPGPTKLWVLIATPHPSGSESQQTSHISQSRNNSTSVGSIAAGITRYIAKVWTDVQETTLKPFQGLDFSWQVLQGWPSAPEFLQPASSTTLHPGFGSWVESAMMLVPLQLCRCEGNQLWPMNDGLPLILDDRHTDVNKVAAEISFGVYDVVFAQAAAGTADQLPVVVVSSMGSQSVGKSYQLNHLAGCFFDVAGGRCTDGCWLTVRKHKLVDGKPCLLVLLDFEGIGSWERTEQEDMLLSLLSAAVSNITLFKTHFTFDRYTRQTLQRFNLGAPKVRAMCGGASSGVFNGNIVFCLKDVQRNAVHEVERAFKQELTKVVQANDNFIAALYHGGVHLMDFPFPADIRFYRQLSNLANQLIIDSSAVEPFGSSLQLCSLLRRLMAKISHKDWTPIHRDTIKSVIEALLLRLHQACAGGCLSDLMAGQAAPSESELQPLLVFDTGLRVADAVLLEFDLTLTSASAATIVSARQSTAVAVHCQTDTEAETQQAAQILTSQDASTSSTAEPDSGTSTSDSTKPVEGRTAPAELDCGTSTSDSTEPDEGRKAPAELDSGTSTSDSSELDEGRIAPANHSMGPGSVTACAHLLSPRVMLLDGTPSRQSSSSSSTAALLDTVSADDDSLQPGAAPEHRCLRVQVDIPDSGVLLQALNADGNFTGPDGQQPVIEHLVKEFLTIVPCCSAAQPDEHLAAQNLQEFLTALVVRRKTRTDKWASDNMRYFLDDHEAKKLLQTTSKIMELMQLNLELCGSRCSSCFMPCLLPRAHSSNSTHNCLGNHQCLHDCAYCAMCEGDSAHCTSAKCQSPAGHPGPHSCGDPSHQCSMMCSLSECSSNCNKHCVLAPCHAGAHHCGAEIHLCGHSCSLDGCSETCSLPHDHDPSIRHQCNNRGCPEKCQLCGFRCSSSDHFHSEQESVDHLCTATHPCSHQCAAEGMCEIRSELRRERRRFTGRRAVFEYEHVTEQTCRRHACIKEIPAGQVTHEGPCVHSEDEAVLHFCAHPCPSCGYRCTKPHGHEGRHETQHGNMRHTFFVSDVEEIDVGERKYVRGELGVAETCDNYCSVMGRGHVHVLPCDPDKCDVGGQASLYDGRRHARCQYSSGQDGHEPQATDELTHDGYWSEISFVDPCTEQQRAEFRLCGAVCGSHAHDQDELEGNSLSYCLLPLWHAPLTTADNAIMPVGLPVHTVSAAGHAYSCQHDTSYNRLHTVLVLDRSGSMASTYIKPVSPEVRGAIDQNRLRLDNVSGVVCEATLAYMRSRQARNANDIISCITFNRGAQVVLAHQSLATPEACSVLLRQIMPHAQPSRGTRFWAGLEQAFDLLRQAMPTHAAGLAEPRPMIILLTDSEDGNEAHSLQLLQQRMSLLQQELPEDRVPQLHVIGYGRFVNARYLERLADAGGGSYVVCGDTAANVEADVSRLQLVGAFEQLAERPDKRGALMVGAANTTAA